MLSYEWRELEVLCDRIPDLRYRYAAAQRSKNVGLSDSLGAELWAANRQHAQLLRHISVELGRRLGTSDDIVENAGPPSERFSTSNPHCSREVVLIGFEA